MTRMPNLPTVLPAGRRRSFPWRDGARGLRVPLLTADPKGDVREGMIRVPNRLVGAEQHTNDRHALEKLLGENIERWAGWYGRRGWTLNSQPKVRGPYDPPVPRPGMESEEGDVKWYFVTARFKRSTPLYIRLDDMMELDSLAKRHGVSFDHPTPPTSLPSREGIADSDRPHDPLKFAAARRRRSGIRREDYLFGGEDGRP